MSITTTMAETGEVVQIPTARVITAVLVNTPHVADLAPNVRATIDQLMTRKATP